MNATETIFALALASNCNPELHFKQAFDQIAEIGQVQFSEIYLIPCRDAVGADYWNAACLLKAAISVDDIIALLKKMETDSGRVRPSHQISLDVDLIAWGQDLEHMRFNPKKLPLALDVKIPMLDIWQSTDFQHENHQFPVVNWTN
ncbi:2-amino-4-hydroxy-6-hydroxymethyldihydropteridine pyrophosphokinase [Acinetobacter sp. ANC 4169]|uniref:2-amino-4-hydroxy-6- hydroxymethyldihydropteridine diphosphokinase n=1 Tax=Acinetobacter sp. ANC 4169 TaxID=1977879 RepID=UPI000A349180|nr:2-amino-4-hydroxy-6-hydroxymethyldihydropteridine diphosphokinase [Acinetobacter sp. ANC 4169]OTG70262.1 2-amino-4-hydroxy-6-hydroxymethyldihydropteridine pyrophosphokinase [Acinetobacter sp. ANC 4169]